MSHFAGRVLEAYLTFDVLSTFSQLSNSFVCSENGDGCGLFTGRELLPRTERPCATLAWHPASHNILASGYERHRSDFGLLVWNLERQEYHKPVAEMGMTDSCAQLVRNLEPHNKCTSDSWPVMTVK